MQYINNFQVCKFTEFNKTIIPFALGGYKIGYNQLGLQSRWLFTISYPTRAREIKLAIANLISNKREWNNCSFFKFGKLAYLEI